MEQREIDHRSSTMVLPAKKQSTEFKPLASPTTKDPNKFVGLGARDS